MRCIFRKYEVYNSLLYDLWTESTKSPIATIVIRGATDNLMDDIERAVDDGVNAYKALTKVCCIYLCMLFSHCH